MSRNIPHSRLMKEEKTYDFRTWYTVCFGPKLREVRLKRFASFQRLIIEYMLWNR